MPDSLPDFPFDPAPRSAHCEKCGAGPDGDLRFLIVRGRDRYLGRTLCDTCSGEVLEALLVSEIEPEAEQALLMTESARDPAGNPGG